MPPFDAFLDSLVATYRVGLLNDTLPFWLKHALDPKCGGYMTCLDERGTVVDTDKGVWQQGRFAWLLAKMFNTVERNPNWLAAAKSGIDFIDRFCFDHHDGRMWFQVSREGLPIRKRRYAFSESFAAIAYAQYARATGLSQYADKARIAFQRFMTHNLHSLPHLAKFESTRPTQGIGFRMIAIATAQELREAIDFEDSNEVIDQSIAVIENEFVKPEYEAVMETVGPGGEILEHFDGRTLNPGHAIEGAWFIMWEGKLRGDDDLIRLGSKMLRWMWKRGWDAEFGGMLYFVDLRGGDVQEYWHDMKFWWPHNETIIATLLAYLLTGDDEFRRSHRAVHDWSFQHFPDKVNGEWFGYLRREGTVSSRLKGNLWKGAFHLPRMQLVCWQLLEERRKQAHYGDGRNR